MPSISTPKTPRPSSPAQGDQKPHMSSLLLIIHPYLPPRLPRRLHLYCLTLHLEMPIPTPISIRMPVPVPMLLMTRNHRRARVIVLLFVRVLGEVRQPEPERLLLVVGADQALAVGADAAEAVAALGPARLHAHACLDARDHVGACGVAAVAARERLGAVRVVAAEVEKVDAREGDEEAADERKGADHVRRVEAVEEDEGRAERGRGEGDIVEGVDAGG